jgi:hypothetical protein
VLDLARELFNQLVGKVGSIQQHTLQRRLGLHKWEFSELKALEQVAKRNMMACRLLQATEASASGDTRFDASWEYQLHWHFPSLVLKRHS